MTEKKMKRIRIKFQNLETPGSDLPFNFEGRNYHLFDGKEYTLPLDVVNHLNSLAVPNPQYEVDPETKQIKQVRQSVKHRFNCMPVNLAKLAEEAVSESEDPKDGKAETK